MSTSTPSKIESEIIQFVGLNDLEAPEKQTAMQICETEFEKLKRKLKGPCKLNVQIKVHGEKHPEGKSVRRKFGIHMKCIEATRTYNSDKAHDYDLSRALRMGFTALAHVIEHQTH